MNKKERLENNYLMNKELMDKWNDIINMTGNDVKECYGYDPGYTESFSCYFPAASVIMSLNITIQGIEEKPGCEIVLVKNGVIIKHESVIMDQLIQISCEDEYHQFIMNFAL